MKFRIFLSILICVASGLAQDAPHLATADALANKGDRAAAIRMYESLLAKDAGNERQVTPRLARQLLWSDMAEKSLPLFRRAISTNADDCELRLDYATALSWSDHLKQSFKEYATIGEVCAKYKTEVLLGQARVLRWMDKPSASSEIYRQLLDDPKAQDAAKIGLVLNLQAEDRYRESRTVAQQDLKAGIRDEALYIAVAGDDVRLGNSAGALNDISDTPKQYASNRQLTDLHDYLERRDNPTIDEHSSNFHDRDGTSYISNETGFRTTTFSTGINFIQGFSRLFGDTVQNAEGSVVADWTTASVDHHFGESLFMNGRVTSSRFRNVGGFDPYTGEINAVITPQDRTRIDITAARVLISDNYQALAHHLVGNFVSAGADIPAGVDWTFTGAMDYTHWTEGNNRMRYRFIPAYRVEGRPRITVSLPMLFQTYDQGFSFNLFSPKRYFEVGPAVNLYIRKWHYWNFSAYGEIGAQHEDAQPWRPMGQVRAHADRDLWRHWATTASVGWSNSNVASPSGFERFSLEAGLSYRFGDEKRRW
ncbi:hypothetical protein Acid345_3363 [Candidatus Koribacter versatilis Ellin345]|uniref:Tetratricopeptide repeat protein n=1 Tax=Koribacter versatilis (strain Ellin345) TaxID=204669 RepID=Q1IL86_KORVE|nr:hypothetical protein [Candidatus Koribacter versatilis]ABF42364.1 hypothetical protein Acid345_3363 [Candidatus Koribacter versatilis Ellin345]